VSALLLLLNYTALQRQPPAIEAMLSCVFVVSVFRFCPLPNKLSNERR
jgi:hypothetical protein